MTIEVRDLFEREGRQSVGVFGDVRHLSFPDRRLQRQQPDPQTVAHVFDLPVQNLSRTGTAK